MVILRSIAAIVAGYAVMVAGAWTAQEVLLPGTEYGKSPLLRILLLGFGTSALGGLGGAVTALLAPRKPFLHLVPTAVLISLETVTLYVTGKVTGPLWFELLAGAALISGTLIAAWLALTIRAYFSRSDLRDAETRAA